VTKTDLIVFDVGYWKGCANQMRDRSKDAKRAAVLCGVQLFFACIAWAASSFRLELLWVVSFLVVATGGNAVLCHLYGSLAKSWDEKSDAALIEHAKVIVDGMLAWRRKEVAKGLAS
jgi:hypothetical protein